jgi:hypothetical protein
VNLSALVVEKNQSFYNGKNNAQAPDNHTGGNPVGLPKKQASLIHVDSEAWFI